MNISKWIVTATVVMASISTPSWADAGSDGGGFFVGANGGTLGLGLNAGYDFGRIRVRAETNAYDFDETVELDGVDYDFELGLDSTGIIIDFAPFNGAFYLAAGIYENSNDINAVSDASGIIIGGQAVPPGTVVTVDAEFDSTSPYAGIGWNFLNNSDAGLGINLDVGVYMNGSADIELTESTGLVPEADINEEEQNIEDDIEDYDMLPVIKLGVTYKF